LQTKQNKQNYRTIANLPLELWREIKSRAAREGKYVYQWINEAIMEKLEKDKGASK